MSRGVTDAVYNRYAYNDEKRAALTAWEDRLGGLVAPAEGNAYSAINKQLSDVETVI